MDPARSDQVRDPLLPPHQQTPMLPPSRTRPQVWFVTVCSCILVWTCLVQLLTMGHLWRRPQALFHSAFGDLFTGHSSSPPPPASKRFHPSVPRFLMSSRLDPRVAGTWRTICKVKSVILLASSCIWFAAHRGINGPYSWGCLLIRCGVLYGSLSKEKCRDFAEHWREVMGEWESNDSYDHLTQSKAKRGNGSCFLTCFDVRNWSISPDRWLHGSYKKKMPTVITLKSLQEQWLSQSILQWWPESDALGNM